jgi:outer membrane murein-binding lipoprotein Lpp
LAEKIPSWLEMLLLPKLSDIGGEIKALNARIDSLEKTIKSLRNEMGSLRNEMLASFDAVNTRIEGQARCTRKEGSRLKKGTGYSFPSLYTSSASSRRLSQCIILA